MDIERLPEHDAKFAEAIRERLDEIWPDSAPHMVNNWMVQVKAFAGDGKEVLYDMTPMTCAPWDKIAMLQHAMMQEQAKMTVAEQCKHDREAHGEAPED